MSPTEIIVLLVVIFAALLLIFTVALLWVRRLGKQRTAALTADYPLHIWVEPVNFFGRKSAGVMQMRGNGTLLLTKDALVFQQWMSLAGSQKRLIVPLKSITETSFPRSFLGKTNGQRLLCIDFTEDGKADAAAWLVRNPDELQTSIDSQRKSK